MEDKKAVVGGLLTKRLDRDIDHNGAAKHAHGQNTTRRAQIDVAARNLDGVLADLDDHTEGSTTTNTTTTTTPPTTTPKARARTRTRTRTPRLVVG